MGDIREFFPKPVVQVVQKDAFERLGLKRMLMEPEFLQAVEADVSLVATLISLRKVMPDKIKDTAREVIAKVVADLVARLDQKTSEALRGAVDRSRRTSRPRFAEIDWPRTIQKNLHTFQPDQQTVIPERLGGLPAQAAPDRRPGRGDPVCRPIRVDGDVRGLCLDLLGGDGLAAGREDQADLL